MFDKLVRSFSKYGYHNRIKITLDNTIIGGHQRKKALKEAGHKLTDKIPVLIPNRALTEEEFKELNIQDNLPFGEFDMDMIANNYEITHLIEWGMPEDWLPSYEEPEEKQSNEAESGNSQNECPNCGHKF